MEKRLDKRRIGILTADGVDAGKFSSLLHALRGAGAEVSVLGLGSGEIRSWNPSGWGETLHIDEEIDDSQADRFDGIVVPGGQKAVDNLRQSHAAVQIIRRTIETGHPLAIIGHATRLLVETELVGGMEVTGSPEIKTDLKNSGAIWSDEPVVVDQGVVTVQSSDVLEQALPKIIEEFAEGRHDRPGITDVVTEASEDSFPASDPPSWQAGTTARREGDEG